MNAYLRTRDATLALRRALQPRQRTPKGQEAAAFHEDRRRMRFLFSDSNLLGFGVTEKMVQGKPVSGALSLTFYVRRKLPKARLGKEAIIPKRFRVQSLGSAVPTDVQALGAMHVAHAGISSGSSIGHMSGTAGTVTLIANDVNSGEAFILSCSHVLARAGTAQPGDSIDSPAFTGGGSSPDVVAQLTNRFMVLDPQVFNTIDGALAEPLAGATLSNDIPGLGTISGVLDLSQTTDQSAINLPVAKFGAVTGLQRGSITGMHITMQIRFPELGDQVVTFTDLITHDIFSQEGDSGGPIIEPASMKVLGMHIASAGASGLCTNIQPVLNILQVGL